MKTATHSPTIAIIGNPNTGKSTLFNLLTGIYQQTGNYPGVTVEKHTGQMRIDEDTFHVVDLPGTYSLSPRSPDECVAVEVLLGERVISDTHRRELPDLVVVVIDASNLRRNLFLISQLLELKLPILIALNMIDVAASAGKEIDVDQLQKILTVPVVEIQANKRKGIDALKRAMQQALENKTVCQHSPFEPHLEQAIAEIESQISAEEQSRRFLAVRAFFDAHDVETIDSQRIQRHYRLQCDPQTFNALVDTKRREHAADEKSFAELESKARYHWISSLLETCQKTREVPVSFSDRIDWWLTHPLFGLVIAMLLMMALFQSVFLIADPGSQLIDSVKGGAANLVESIMPAGALRSLIVDGMLEGVGAVIVFLPQILLLFLFLALLEDTGYLARVAFLMDRYLSRIGLSGSSLIPLLSSFACAIPGIMATRVIQNRRDRLITILIAPLMTCSARLPVYVLLIATFVPSYYFFKFMAGPIPIGLHSHGTTMFALYLLGIVTAILVAWVLKKTILPGASQTFVMELPSYKFPVWRNVFRRVFDGGWSFVRDAGTLIFAVTIIVWAAAYFPRNQSGIEPGWNDRMEELEGQIAAAESKTTSKVAPETLVAWEAEKANLENRIAAAHLRQSYLGRGGQLIEPVVRPLGWDWRIGSAVIAAFPAREVVVSTMGVIFGLGNEQDEASDSLRSTLQNATWEGTDRPLFTLPVALSILVFFALCAQCVSTLAVIKRETQTYRWPIFTFVYMTVLAYVAAFLTFQIAQHIVS
jgi:ferrous iron transport protein B